ncbi:IS3 family transposase [Tardiphaga sp.]|uniref:IS3 family transposase n=1 Tax=Tardiphaga sp. TaxID=1926292 RepID=UPI00352A8271
MGMARSTFYDEPIRAADDTAIVSAMAGICDEFGHYGWRRVQAALRQQGVVVNHKKVRRLMREHDLQPRMRRRFTTTTDSDHDQPIFPNLAKTVAMDRPDHARCPFRRDRGATAAARLRPSFRSRIPIRRQGLPRLPGRSRHRRVHGGGEAIRTTTPRPKAS